MLCPDCQETHGLYSNTVNRKGMVLEQLRWVRKDIIARVDAASKALEQAKKRVEQRLIDEFGTPWLAHFHGRTKKQIWEDLVADGRTYPSLGTFYKHVRHAGLDRELSWYLRFEEAETVLRVLKRSDSQLATLLSDAKRCEQELHAAHTATYARTDA